MGQYGSIWINIDQTKSKLHQQTGVC